MYVFSSLFLLLYSVELHLFPRHYNFILLLIYTNDVLQYIRNLDVMSNFSTTLAYSCRSKISSISQQFYNIMVSTALELYMILKYESNLY